MNLANADVVAEGVRTRKQAARHYNSVQRELEYGEPSDRDRERGEAALRHLEGAFPGIQDDANEITEPPQLSRRAKQNMDSGGERQHGGRRHSSGGSSPGGAQGERRSGGRASSGRSRSSSSPRNSGGGGGQAREVVERAAGFTGSDVGDAIITGLQLLLVGGLAYQVLQPKGAGAFSSILSGIGRGFNAIVAPVDPLAALGSSSSTSSSGPPATPLTTSPAPAASVSSPGPVTVPGGAPHAQRAPNMFTDPFAPFPKLATGPLGSHVKAPTSPLAIGG